MQCSTQNFTLQLHVHMNLIATTVSMHGHGMPISMEMTDTFQLASQTDSSSSLSLLSLERLMFTYTTSCTSAKHIFNSWHFVSNYPFVLTGTCYANQLSPFQSQMCTTSVWVPNQIRSRMCTTSAWVSHQFNRDAAPQVKIFPPEGAFTSLLLFLQQSNYLGM